MVGKHLLGRMVVSPQILRRIELKWFGPTVDFCQLGKYVLHLPPLSDGFSCPVG
jgi:hypothetical protein